MARCPVLSLADRLIPLTVQAEPPSGAERSTTPPPQPRSPNSATSPWKAAVADE